MKQNSESQSLFSPDVPTKKRVERWAISLEDVVIDPLGVQVSTAVVTSGIGCVTLMPRSAQLVTSGIGWVTLMQRPAQLVTS